MAEVLYRKYRSRAFAEVQGQEAVITVLLNSLRNGKFAHAYLLTGPRGTGKTTIARLIAKAVNCENFMELGDVCNHCNSCLAVETSSHIDVLEIDAASNRGIEEIRQIRDTINFLPNSGKYKVFIIDEAHMLTREAFNALLKTLEEPPAHVLFLMATTEPHKIPVTILSRLQRFDLKLASSDQLTTKLTKILDAEGYKADKDVFDLLYSYSEGSYRDAESILGKILSSLPSEKTITITSVSELLGLPSAALVKAFLGYLIAGEVGSALQKVAETSEAGTDFAHLVKSMTNTLREMIVAMVKDGKKYDRELAVLHTLMGLQSEIKISDDMRLLLEIAILKLGSQPVVKQVSQVPAAAPTPQISPLPQPVKAIQPKMPAAVAPVVADSQPEVVEASQPSENTKSDEKASKDENELWERLMLGTRKIDFRLFTVLKTCTSKLDGTALKIFTNYQSNITTLQAAETVAKLRPLIDMIYSAQTVLEFNLTIDPQTFAESERIQSFMTNSNANLVEEMF